MTLEEGTCRGKGTGGGRLRTRGSEEGGGKERETGTGIRVSKSRTWYGIL